MRVMTALLSLFIAGAGAASVPAQRLDRRQEPVRVSPEELAEVSPDVRHLVVYGPADADLARLDRFPRLEGLSLEPHSDSSGRMPVFVTDDGMRHIAALTKLRVLRLHGCRGLTGPRLATLESLPVLQELSLRGSALADEDLAALASLPSLRRLSLVGVPDLGDEALAHVAKIAGLQELDLRRQTWLTPDGLVRLAALEQLRVLDLNEVGGWRLSSRLPPPEHAAAGVDDRVLEAIGKLPRLEVLRIAQAAKVTGDGVRHLGELPALRELDLSHTAVADADLAAIEGPLEILLLDHCPRITGSALHRFEHLSALSLEGCTALTAAAFAEMTGATLRSLSLRYCEQLGGEVVPSLARWRGLERLDLGKCVWVRDEHLRALGKLAELRFLSLDGCKRITDAGLEHLKGLTQLEEFDLRANPNVTADGVLALEGLPLRRLTVAACGRLGEGVLSALRARWSDCEIVR